MVVGGWGGVRVVRVQTHDCMQREQRDVCNTHERSVPAGCKERSVWDSRTFVLRVRSKATVLVRTRRDFSQFLCVFFRLLQR